MPTVSVYISNEDYDKFRAIQKKSEFIHNALNSSALVRGMRAKNMKPLEPTFTQEYPEPVVVTRDEVGDISLGGRVKLYDKIKPENKLCRHGIPPTFCKFAKPGRPCK